MATKDISKQEALSAFIYLTGSVKYASSGHQYTNAEKECIDILEGYIKSQRESPIDKTIDKVCENLPGGWRINLCMESGAVTIELINHVGYKVALPGTGKTLTEQLNDALCVANGWAL